MAIITNDLGLIVGIDNVDDGPVRCPGDTICNNCEKIMPKIWDTICSHCSRSFCYDCSCSILALPELRQYTS